MPTSCQVCSSNRNVCLFSRSDKSFGRQQILRCKDCGLVFAHPLPEQAVLENHYNEYFFTEKFDYVKSGGKWERFYEFNLAYIERIKEKGKLLEVGCGLGHFLKVAKARGWQASGVELSEFAAEYARENLGLDIYTGELENACFCDNQFDAVVLWATLEHFVDPVGKLREIWRILKPQGLLAVSVPNRNSLLTRLLGMKNTDMYYCEHIYLFPLRTIKKMLSKVGFVDMRRMVIFGGSPNNRRIQDLMQFIARRLNIGSEIRLVAFKK